MGVQLLAFLLVPVCLRTEAQGHPIEEGGDLYPLEERAVS